MANFIRPMNCIEGNAKRNTRRKIQRMIVSIHAYDHPFGGEIHPNVDVEFWRQGSGKNWLEYEDLSPDNFRRLIRALSGAHAKATDTYAESNCLTIHFYVS